MAMFPLHSTALGGGSLWVTCYFLRRNWFCGHGQIPRVELEGHGFLSRKVPLRLRRLGACPTASRDLLFSSRTTHPAGGYGSDGDDGNISSLDTNVQ